MGASPAGAGGSPGRGPCPVYASTARATPGPRGSRFWALAGEDSEAESEVEDEDAEARRAAPAGPLVCDFVAFAAAPG